MLDRVRLPFRLENYRKTARVEILAVTLCRLDDLYPICRPLATRQSQLRASRATHGFSSHGYPMTRPESHYFPAHAERHWLGQVDIILQNHAAPRGERKHYAHGLNSTLHIPTVFRTLLILPRSLGL